MKQICSHMARFLSLANSFSVGTQPKEIGPQLVILTTVRCCMRVYGWPGLLTGQQRQFGSCCVVVLSLKSCECLSVRITYLFQQKDIKSKFRPISLCYISGTVHKLSS